MTATLDAPTVTQTKREPNGSGRFPEFYVVDSYAAHEIDGESWRWPDSIAYIVWRNRNTCWAVDWEGKRCEIHETHTYRINSIEVDQGVLRQVTQDEAESHRLMVRDA